MDHQMKPLGEQRLQHSAGLVAVWISSSLRLYVITFGIESTETAADLVSHLIAPAEFYYCVTHPAKLFALDLHRCARTYTVFHFHADTFRRKVYAAAG
jgi:hypothetical protein